VVQVPAEIFISLDLDGSGIIAFEEINGWLYGNASLTQSAQTPVAIKSAACPLTAWHCMYYMHFRYGNAQLSMTQRGMKAAQQLDLGACANASLEAGDEPWDAARLRQELHLLLLDHGLQAIDLVRAWDRGTKSGSEKGGDALVTSREYMMSLKKLVRDEDLWYGMVRDGAHEAFMQIDTSGDGSLGLPELMKWIDPHNKLSSNSKRCSELNSKDTKEAVRTRSSQARPSTGGARVSFTSSAAPAEQNAQDQLDTCAPSLDTTLEDPTDETPQTGGASGRASAASSSDRLSLFSSSKVRAPPRKTPLWAPRPRRPPPVYLYQGRPAFNSSRSSAKWSAAAATAHLKPTSSIAAVPSAAKSTAAPAWRAAPSVPPSTPHAAPVLHEPLTPPPAPPPTPPPPDAQQLYCCTPYADPPRDPSRILVNTRTRLAIELESCEHSTLAVLVARRTRVRTPARPQGWLSSASSSSVPLLPRAHARHRRYLSRYQHRRRRSRRRRPRQLRPRVSPRAA
jgi:hypothetical protein